MGNDRLKSLFTLDGDATVSNQTVWETNHYPRNTVYFKVKVNKHQALSKTKYTVTSSPNTCENCCADLIGITVGWGAREALGT